MSERLHLLHDMVNLYWIYDQTGDHLYHSITIFTSRMSLPNKSTFYSFFLQYQATETRAAFIASGNYGVSLVHRQNRVHGPGGDGKFPNSPLVNWDFFKRLDLHNL